MKGKPPAAAATPKKERIGGGGIGVAKLSAAAAETAFSLPYLIILFKLRIRY